MNDNSFTERYLAEVLRHIPERQRSDVERELRSSIGDAIDDRSAAGEERAASERAVLEGLGDPARLAASMTGKPNFLIGPELYPHWRRLLGLLLSIVVPIVGVALFVVEIAGGGTIGEAIVRGGGTAFNVAVHLVFWVTLVFAVGERFEAGRKATELAAGKWTLDQLPKRATGRISIIDMITEVLTLLITIGGLLILQGLTFTDSATGQQVSILEPALVNFWLPFLIAMLAALVVVQLVVFSIGHWSIPLAVVFTALELGFAVPIVYLALNGMLVNPAFAQLIGYPPLAEGDGALMIVIAISVALVTGWEIFDAFRKALRSQREDRAVLAS